MIFIGFSGDRDYPVIDIRLLVTVYILYTA